MTITYNQLDLPKTVTKGTDNLEYIYDARGNKLALKVNGTVDKYYTGEIVYKNDRTVDYLLTPEGMARPSGGNFAYQYNLTDHLGSVRAVVNQSGTVDQATDYYPFGLAHINNNLKKNNYLYNNKEMQDKTLGGAFFGMLDYGARFYDSAIGRFHTQDRFAEKYLDLTPYHYTANNPIRFIDINGESVRVTNEYQKNERLMKGHNEWLKTDGGKEFMKLFGEGGKSENIAVVFDAVDPNTLENFGASAGEKLELVDSESKSTRIYSGTVSNEVAEAARGKSNGSYIRSTLRFGKFAYEGNDKIAELVDTQTHEGQHTMISVFSILKNNKVPSTPEQDHLMKNTNGSYFKTRFNSFLQVRGLWDATYNNINRANKIEIGKYVQNRVNDF